MISGFTFIHNALNGGYPLLEAIGAVLPYVHDMLIVDIGSDDGTEQLLQDLTKNERINVSWMEWDTSQRNGLLGTAHAKHVECTHDTIIHFEADEVYDDSLIRYISSEGFETTHASVYRLQVEQNFQRIRWYHEPCHRMFEKGTVTKSGNTTDVGYLIETVDPEQGLLWDVTNCFRDQFEDRLRQNEELWQQGLQYRMTPWHSSLNWNYTEEEFRKELEHPRWLWTSSPYKLPGLLLPHIGKTKYQVRSKLVDAIKEDRFRELVQANQAIAISECNLLQD